MHTVLVQTNIGDLICSFYEEFLLAFGDPDMAAVMTAQAINRLLEDQSDSADLDAIAA